MARSSYLISAAAVTAAALAGGAGVDVRTRWYRRLDEPGWDPSPRAYGPVWTGACALLAVAGGRLLDRAPRQERAGTATALGVNLALNAAWTWVFFRAERPGWATVEAAALDASTIDLVRRAWRTDRLSAGLLVPYAAWTGFATALTAAIARRNEAG